MSRYLSSSTLVFLVILGFLVFWIGGGMLGREAPEVADPIDVQVPEVAASLAKAEMIRPRTVLFGNIVPNQTSILRARTGGIVEEVVQQGVEVEAGEQLARLSADDREASLARAAAELQSAERDYEAARQLQDRGVTSEAELQERFAALEAARAEVRAAELELQNTLLKAPIAGTVSDVLAEIGSFVQPGGEVLEIVDIDPLVAEVEVRQTEIGSVYLGQSARVTFQGGRQADAEVSFIAPVASAETRTFHVELEIANRDAEVPAGLSAEIAIPTDPVTAHRVSPALIRLDDAGRIGVFTVGEDGETLKFQPVDIVQARAEALWVTGLPDPVRIVTISQGALQDGQKARVSETPDPYRGVVGDMPDAPDPEGAAALLGAADAAGGTDTELR